MAQESIAHKTARTAFWSGVERVVNLGASFVVTIVLARLLVPEDYGVVAMLAVFVNIADRVVESGVLNALIRKQKGTCISQFIT